MEEIEGYTFGHVYKDFIDPKDADKFARVFGEGSPALTELIKFCIENGITTNASCKGHPEKTNPLEALLERGYITFGFNGDKELAYYIASFPLRMRGTMVIIDNNNYIGPCITIEVPAIVKNQSEVYFKGILDYLKKFVLDRSKGISEEPDSTIKKIIDYEFAFTNNEWFYIKHDGFKKYENNNGLGSKVGRCPNYKNSILYRLMNKAKIEDKENEVIHGHIAM